MANQFNFFRGMVGPRVVGTGGALLNEPYIPLQITHAPPGGMSYRHWNILPQDLRGGERENMELYIEGWEAARNANYNNPYPDQLRGEVWNRGWHAWWARRNREIDAEQELVRMAFDTSDEFQIHSFTIGTHNTQIVLEYLGEADIRTVNAMTWCLKYRYANYVSINEQVLGFMEEYLNLHLSGTSTIRLA